MRRRWLKCVTIRGNRKNGQENCRKKKRLICLKLLLKSIAALIPFNLFFVSSDSANSHPPRSPVYTGPSTAVQCGGPQPGAGRHVHLPATTSPAQGNCHLPSIQHTHVQRFRSCFISKERKVALNILVTLITWVKHCFFFSISSAPWGSRRSPGSSPSAELQQWISERPCHHTTVLIFLVLLTKPPSHLHLTQLWRCTAGCAPRLVSKYKCVTGSKFCQLFRGVLFTMSLYSAFVLSTVIMCRQSWTKCRYVTSVIVWKWRITRKTKERVNCCVSLAPVAATQDMT